VGFHGRLRFLGVLAALAGAGNKFRGEVQQFRVGGVVGQSFAAILATFYRDWPGADWRCRLGWCERLEGIFARQGVQKASRGTDARPGGRVRDPASAPKYRELR